MILPGIPVPGFPGIGRGKKNIGFYEKKVQKIHKKNKVNNSGQTRLTFVQANNMEQLHL